MRTVLFRSYKIGNITRTSSYRYNLAIPFKRKFSTSLSMTVFSVSVTEWYGLVAPLSASGIQPNSKLKWVTASKIKGSDVIFSHSWRECWKPPALRGAWFPIMPTTELWLNSVEDPTESLLMIGWGSAGTMIGPHLKLMVRKTHPKSSNPSTFFGPLNGGDKPGTMVAKALSRRAFRGLICIHVMNRSRTTTLKARNLPCNLKTIMDRICWMLCGGASMFLVMTIPQSAPAWSLHPTQTGGRRSEVSC